MKLTFLSHALHFEYTINGTLINGVDVSLFTEGSKFVGNAETEAAGIFNMFWREGELHVTLAQLTQTTGVSWGASAIGWIDADTYDPQARYVQATNPQALKLLDSGKAEYWCDPDSGAWTVRMVEFKEQEPAE